MQIALIENFSSSLDFFALVLYRIAVAINLTDQIDLAAQTSAWQAQDCYKYCRNLV